MMLHKTQLNFCDNGKISSRLFITKKLDIVCVCVTKKKYGVINNDSFPIIKGLGNFLR